jgi:hypothetical protein
MDGDELDFENEEPAEGEYISDFPTNEKPVEQKKAVKHAARQSIPQSAKNQPGDYKKGEGLSVVGKNVKKPVAKKK